MYDSDCILVVDHQVTESKFGEEQVKISIKDYVLSLFKFIIPHAM